MARLRIGRVRAERSFRAIHERSQYSRADFVGGSNRPAMGALRQRAVLSRQGRTHVGKVRAGKCAKSGQAGEAIPRQESLERLRRSRRWPLRRHGGSRRQSHRLSTQRHPPLVRRTKTSPAKIRVFFLGTLFCVECYLETRAFSFTRPLSMLTVYSTSWPPLSLSSFVFLWTNTWKSFKLGAPAFSPVSVRASISF